MGFKLHLIHFTISKSLFEVFKNETLEKIMLQIRVKRMFPAIWYETLFLFHYKYILKSSFFSTTTPVTFLQ